MTDEQIAALMAQGVRMDAWATRRGDYTIKPCACSDAPAAEVVTDGGTVEDREAAAREQMVKRRAERWRTK